jgi:tetratricopeptide (TPR) repeat protein
MSPRQRRTHRAFLHAVSDFAADLPVVLARMARRRGGSDGRRTGRWWTRPRRIAAALVGVTVLAAAGTTVVIMSRVRDPAQTARRLHAQAADQFEAGRFEDAAATWRKILDVNPADKYARFDLGAALLRLGREDEGLREIRAAAVLDAEFDDAHFALAQYAATHGDEETALVELRFVVARPPRPGAADSMLAAILLRRGRVVEAVPHLEAAAADASAPALARIRDGVALGRIHGTRSSVQRVAAREKRLESDCYAAARQVADEALARAAGDASAPVAELRAARAEALLAAGRAQEALVDADLALDATKDAALSAAVRLLRAQIYSTLNDAAAAERELAGALAGDAKPSASAFRAVAGMYSARGRLDRAIEILDRGVDLHADDVELGLDRANALFASGAPDALDAALVQCARIAAADKKSVAASILAGDIRRARDDLAGARKSYEEAVARDPNDVQAKLRVAGTAIAESGAKSADAAERLAEAERIARDVLAASPKEPAALLALAKVQLSRSPGRDSAGRADKGNEEARVLLTESVDGDPTSLEARTFLAYAEYLTRNDEAAAVELKQVLATFREGRPWLRLLLARCLYEARSYPAAAAEAALAVAGLPDEADAWSVRAAAAREAGDFDGALDALRRLETLEPKNLLHLFQQAALLGKAGKFAAAEERFSVADERVRAIADEGGRADAEILVAQARSEFYKLRGDVERARGALGAVVDKNPTRAAPYVTYARFLLGIGRTDEAELQVERGLATEPTNLDARRLRCEIEFSRRSASPILLTQIREVERAAEKSADALRLVDYLRGKLATLQGDLRVAKELLTRYVAAAPDDADGKYSLGVALAAAGEFAEAVKRFESAGALLPGSAEVRVALAKTRQAWALDMMRRGRFVEAKATLVRAASDDPSSREVHALLADSLRFTGDVDLSEKEVRALLRADPADAAALRMLGAIEVQQGRLDAAATTLRGLVKVAADDWSAWRFLSAVLADKGELDAAETAAKAARAAAPDEPGALAALLHVLAERKDFAGAEREIAAAAQKHPEEAQYPYFLAMLCEQQGRHEDAVVAAGRALDLRPATPGALQIAVFALSSGLHDSDRAAAFARERAAKAKDDAAMTCLLAQVEADLGRRAEALALLGPVCALDAPPPYALSLRGLLLIETGDFSGARDAMKKGLAAYPDFADLHYLLSQAWLQDPANSKDGEPQEPARGFAVAELRAALATAKTHAPALNNLAWLLSRDEATRAEALACAETAVRLHPEHATYLDTWATVLARIGRNDQALAALRRALGACEAERGRIEQAAEKKMSTTEGRRIDALRERHERMTTEIKGRYEEALRASTSR